MAKIPIASPVQPVRQSGINPNAIAGAFDAVERFAQQGEKANQYTINTLDVVQNAQDAVELMKAKNQIEDDFLQAHEGLLNNSDYKQFDSYVQNTSDTLSKKYQQAYGNDPKVWNAVSGFIGAKTNELKGAALTERVKLIGQEGQAQLATEHDKAALSMARATTPEERTAAETEFKATVEASVNRRIITKAQGDNLVQGLEFKAQKTQVIEGLRSTDPRTIISTIDAIDKHDFTAIERDDPEWLANAKMSAEARLQAVRGKLKTQLDESTVNESVTSLSADWAIDGKINFVAANKDLNSQEFQKRHGLLDANGKTDVDRVNKVRATLSSMESEQTQADKQASDKYEKGLATSYLKGNYSAVIKALSSPDNPMSATDIRTWTNAIREKIKEGPADPVAAARSIIAANDAIRRGTKTPDEIRRSILTDPNLKKEDKEQYLNRLDSKLDRQIEQGRNEGHSIIEKIIAPKVTNPLGFMSSDPKMVIPVMEAQQSLDTWIDKQTKAGKDLTIFEITDQAKRIATEIHPASKSVTSIADMADQIDQRAKDAEAKKKAKK